MSKVNRARSSLEILGIEALVTPRTEIKLK